MTSKMKKITSQDVFVDPILKMSSNNLNELIMMRINNIRKKELKIILNEDLKLWNTIRLESNSESFFDKFTGSHDEVFKLIILLKALDSYDPGLLIKIVFFEYSNKHMDFVNKPGDKIVIDTYASNGDCLRLFFKESVKHRFCVAHLGVCLAGIVEKYIR